MNTSVCCEGVLGTTPQNLLVLSSTLTACEVLQVSRQSEVVTRGTQDLLKISTNPSIFVLRKTRTGFFASLVSC